MGSILHLFSGRVFGRVGVEEPAPAAPAAVDTQAVSTAAFSELAETQLAADYSLGSVIQGLDALAPLVGHLASLKGDVSGMFEEHRKLALAKFTLEKDQESLLAKYRERCETADAQRDEIKSLTGELTEARAVLERSRSEIEAIEHRHHLFVLQKKEVDDLLAKSANQLQIAQEDGDGLRLELDTWRQQSEVDAARISDLTQKYDEAYANASHLANRCEAHEEALRVYAEDVSDLREQLNVLARERDVSVRIGHQKEQEVSELRTELVRTLDRNQADIRAKDNELSQARLELDNLQSGNRVLEQVNGELKIRNENLVTEVRQLSKAKRQLELSVTAQEQKVSRLTASLLAANAAKADLSQSRSAMSSRIEALTQSLLERESDLERVEAHVLRLTAQLEDQSSRSRDAVEVLNERLLDLEKQLITSRNEIAFYSAQVDLRKVAGS